MSSNERRTVFYERFDQDFVESANQSFELPAGFDWLDDGVSTRVLRAVSRPVGFVWASAYWHLVMHAEIVNRQVLQEAQGRGFFLFGNHTQPVGDVLLPRLVARPTFPYVLASTANLGIPVLGRLLPAFGALPVTESVQGLKQLMEAVETRIAQGSCVAIYPEAHVWPWCTFVRAFPTTPFTLPVQLDAPSFCMTVTYQARTAGRTDDCRSTCAPDGVATCAQGRGTARGTGSATAKKPQATVYVDGPFLPDATLPRRERKQKLRDQVYACMAERAKQSTCAYVDYRPQEAGTRAPHQSADARAPRQEVVA